MKNLFFIVFLNVVSVVFAGYEDKIMGASNDGSFKYVINRQQKRINVVGFLFSESLTEREMAQFTADFNMRNPNDCALGVINHNNMKYPGENGFEKTLRSDIVKNGWIVGKNLSTKEKLAIKWAIFKAFRKI